MTSNHDIKRMHVAVWLSYNLLEFESHLTRVNGVTIINTHQSLLAKEIVVNELLCFLKNIFDK